MLWSASTAPPTFWGKWSRRAASQPRTGFLMLLSAALPLRLLGRLGLGRRLQCVRESEGDMKVSIAPGVGGRFGRHETRVARRSPDLKDSPAGGTRPGRGRCVSRRRQACRRRRAYGLGKASLRLRQMERSGRGWRRAPRGSLAHCQPRTSQGVALQAFASQDDRVSAGGPAAACPAPKQKGLPGRIPGEIWCGAP